MDLQTARSVEKMEAALYNVYDKTSKGIDDKLLEFASVLNRIGIYNLEHLDYIVV